MNKTYEYTFVRLPIRGGFFSGKFDTDYREVIEQHAQQGWRFVQAYAPAISGYGSASKVDLIFERPRQ